MSRQNSYLSADKGFPVNSGFRYQRKYQHAFERSLRQVEDPLYAALPCGRKAKYFWRVGDSYVFSLVSLVWQGFIYLQVYLQHTQNLGDKAGDTARFIVTSVVPLLELLAQRTPVPPTFRRRMELRSRLGASRVLK